MTDILGIIETLEFATIVEISDAMVKATGVELRSFEFTRLGHAAVICGDIATVNKAMEVGRCYADLVGESATFHAIPRKVSQIPNRAGDSNGQKWTVTLTTFSENSGG